jgi:hypothetical protein
MLLFVFLVFALEVYAMVFQLNQNLQYAAAQRAFQPLFGIFLVAAAFTGISLARAPRDLQPPGSVEAQPHADISKQYWFYAKLFAFINTVVALFTGKFAAAIQNPLVNPLIGNPFVLSAIYFFVSLLQFHFFVKACGDVLLGIHAWWSKCPLGKGMLLKLQARIEDFGEASLCGRAVNMWSRGIRFRVFLLWLCLLAFLQLTQRIPDADMVSAFRLVASPGSGFSRIRKAADIAPFQKFIEGSWKSDASKDSVVPKANRIRVRWVLKLKPNGAATQLASYQGAKQILRSKFAQGGVQRIETRWNPDELTHWSKNDPYNNGVRTTKLLNQHPKILDGLADRGEDRLDENINEAMLFHGTSGIQAVQGIMSGGFRIDLAGSARGTLYGAGAYLADMASKSDDYAVPLLGNSFFRKTTKFLILCKAALGNADSVPPGDQKIVGLNQKYHSKYAGQHLYNEYVIMDATQAYCPYTVLYRDGFDWMSLPTVATEMFGIALIVVFSLVARVGRVFPG